jgi:TDG/mug DNA glycosylase family protein
MARRLGVTGLQLRNWLRGQAEAGHPLLASHQRHARWEFMRAEAEQLMAEFGARRSRPSNVSGRRETPRMPKRERAARSGGTTNLGRARPLSQNPGHRRTEEWMGEKVLTLADLLRPGLRTVVVGINPSPVSVAAGHYYQGQFGKRFFARLTGAGLLPDGDGFEDDQAFAADIGFTDVVKRPTTRETGLRLGELDHGRELLEAKLAPLAVSRILFTYKGAAKALLGPFQGHGALPGRPLFGAAVFVMPGPMERTDRVVLALRQLRNWWSGG